jgi:integrase
VIWQKGALDAIIRVSRSEALRKEEKKKMGLFHRGKVYWFSYQFDGRRVYKSLKTKNKKVAERRYAKTISEIVDGTYHEVTLARKNSFKDMADKYLSEHGHSRDPYTIKRLMDFFYGCKISEISTKLISEYRNDRLKVVRPATLYQELALLRRMFSVAIKEWEWVRDNPVSRLSFAVGNKNARDRWLTKEEEQRLLASATNPKWLRSLLVVALHSGMRQGEILGLKWQDVDFARKLVAVVKSKNGEKRSIPMSETLNETLKSIKVRNISGRVFPIALRSLRVAFEKALRKAEIEDFHFHDLRHSFATKLVQNGVDLYKLKELLGHKTVSMTARYAHHYPESLRESVHILDKCYKSVTLVVNAVDI